MAGQNLPHPRLVARVAYIGFQHQIGKQRDISRAMTYCCRNDRLQVG
jgi:hypothetical protein